MHLVALRTWSFIAIAALGSSCMAIRMEQDFTRDAALEALCWVSLNRSLLP